MLPNHHARQIVAVLLPLIMCVVAIGGCATTADTASGQYTSDTTLASDVKTRLTADSPTNYVRVGVSSNQGTVYLAGTVDSPERASRAALLASQVSGVRNVVNNIQTASVVPSTRSGVAAAPPATTVTPSATQPVHPPIDVSGVVARYDPQTGVVIFQDGRSVRLSSASVVWGPASTSALQPGAQVFIRDAQPVSVGGAAVSPGIVSWRTGTVNQIDQTNGLIYLNDGAVVRMGPTTVLRSGDQRVALSQLRPGSQIAIGVVGAPPASTTISPAVSATVPSPSASPRLSVTPLDSPEIRILIP